MKTGNECFVKSCENPVARTFRSADQEMGVCDAHQDEVGEIIWCYDIDRATRMKNLTAKIRLLGTKKET